MLIWVTLLERRKMKKKKPFSDPFDPGRRGTGRSKIRAEGKAKQQVNYFRSKKSYHRSRKGARWTANAS